MERTGVGEDGDVDVGRHVEADLVPIAERTR